MKLLRRLFCKKHYLEMAVNEDFTKNGVVETVMFAYYDTSSNLKVLIDCIELHDYDNETLNSFISILEQKVINTKKWREGKRLSQGGLGNWAGRLWNLEDMITMLKSKKVRNNLK
jgi:hypothetical protein